ncbi:MAG: hypothetical protein Kow006_03220 [Gammaproteobacteria bacterium]
MKTHLRLSDDRHIYSRAAFSPAAVASRPSAITDAQSEFTALLRALQQVSSQGEQLPTPQRWHVWRAVLAISASLADIRTVIAGGELPKLPNGVLAGLEYELIALDYGDVETPAGALFARLDDIHRRAERLNRELLAH